MKTWKFGDQYLNGVWNLTHSKTFGCLKSGHAQISDNYCTYIFMFKNVQNLDGILNKNQFLDASRLFGNFLAHLKKFICLPIQTPNQSKQIVFLCVSCQTMQSLWQVNTYTKPQKLNEPEEFSLSFFYVYLLILFGV